MDLIGLLPKTSSGNQYVIVFIDLYKILARAIRILKVTSTHAAYVLIDNWGIPYGTGTQKSSMTVNLKLFQMFCSALWFYRRETGNNDDHFLNKGQIKD